MLVKVMLSPDYVKFLWSLETVCPERVPTVKDDDRKKDDDKKKDSLCKPGCLYEGPCPSSQLDSDSCVFRKC